MPNFACEISCGATPSFDCINDEYDIVVTSVTRSATREERLFRDSSGCVAGVTFFNPILEIQVEGNPLECDPATLSGFHPGTVINEAIEPASAPETPVAADGTGATGGAAPFGFQNFANNNATQTPVGAATASCFDFLYSDGCTIYVDPSLTCTNDAAPVLTFTARHYPFATA